MAILFLPYFYIILLHKKLQIFIIADIDDNASINLLIMKINNIKHFTNFFYLHRFVDNGMISP